MEFINVLKAIPNWKKENERLESEMDSEEAYETKESWEQWQDENEENDENLRKAFFEDTKEYNSYSNCMLADPLWIIKIAKD